MTDKDKEKEKLKTYFILYGMLWFLGLVIAGALGYNKHVNGDATIFTGNGYSNTFRNFLLVISIGLGDLFKMDVHLLDWGLRCS